MEYLWIAILIIVILIGLVIFFRISDLKDINKNLDIAKDRVRDLLNKKKGLILELKDLLEKKKVSNIYIKDDDTDILSLDDSLVKASSKIQEFKEEDFSDYKKAKPILKKLALLEDDIDGLKDYYNTYANKYNLHYERKPFIYIYKLFKFEKLELFKQKKLEQYEILKED